MDKILLEYFMKKNKVSTMEMCTVCGLGRSTFWRKCNGISEFTQSEMQRIIDRLELSRDEAMDNFLPKKYPKRNTTMRKKDKHNETG